MTALGGKCHSHGVRRANPRAASTGTVGAPALAMRSLGVLAALSWVTLVTACTPSGSGASCQTNSDCSGASRCYAGRCTDPCYIQGCPAGRYRCVPHGGCLPCRDGGYRPNETFVDCEALESPAGLCGNGVCDGWENEVICPIDCPCGNGVCDEHETYASCPTDCPAPEPECGDGVCDPQETHDSCPADCPSPEPECGDGVCHWTESPESCPADCPIED